MRGSSSKQLVPCRSSLSWSFFEEGACVKIRKVLTVALLAFLCLSLYFASAPASAEDIAVTEQEGLCVHHPAHTAACGYEPETEAGVCTHVHDESCGYVAPVEEQPCAHVHDETCGYAEAEEEVPCDQDCTDLDDDNVLDHIEGCAYQPAVEGQPCTHAHDETCGYVPPVEEQPCTHIHDETCGYGVPAAAGVCIYAESGCPYCVVDWQWSDPQQLLTQEEDGSWSLYLPGVSASNPISRQGLQGLLPEEIAVYMDDMTRTTIAIAWDLTAVPDDAAGGDYLLEAYPADGTYTLTETAQPLEVTLRLGGAETYELVMPSGEPPFEEHIVTGVSPAGTTINLFDYWLVDRTTQDDENPTTNDNDPSTWLVNLGINNGHALQFSKGNNSVSKGLWNLWTNSSAPRVGMVQNKLSGGYPRLDVDTASVDDDVIKARDGNESMAYLFDPNIVHTGKQSFKDVKGLLQVDADGYYYYDSTKNYAVYYSDTNSFTLYEFPGVEPGGSSPVGQFFPFNEANADAEVVTYKDKQYTLMNTSTSTDAPINHYFGMHMSTRFIQQNGGYMDEEQKIPITYEFSGDDDVWIFIDDILVADLGGIHDMASVTIDFANGTVVINEGKDSVQTLSLQTLMDLSDATFANNTYHTLDLFYLERGNTDSNLYLRYNLVTIPETSLIKVDQVGEPVPGAEFKLFAANNLRQSIATGVTDVDGSFVFRRTEGDIDYDDFGERPITIDELYQKYNGINVNGNSLILKETQTPAGYRTNGDVGLKFETVGTGENEKVVLLSNSTWDKGAYAMPKVTATMPEIITLNDSQGNPIIDKTVDLTEVENPLIFAVVFQRRGDSLTDWRPVSGDPIRGWKVHEGSTWDYVLAAARANPYIFTLGSGGRYQAEITNLPGDIATYYNLLGTIKGAKYTVGYYYSEASSLEQVTSNNTYRISALEGRSDGIDRVFSVNLYVSNIKNRLMVQKVDDEGTPVTGAVFSLYKEEQVSIAQDGTIAIPDNAVPYDTLTTSNNTGIDGLEGGGIFPTAGHILEAGEYYLVETSAPTGYRKSEVITPVAVDNTGVYASAGEKGDGVEVLRGVGSIIRSMVQFAADDDVDATLHDIQAALAVAEDDPLSLTADDADWNKALHLQYENAHAMLDYGLYEGESGDLDTLTFKTDVGWPKLFIRQCYNHDGAIDTSKKTDLGERDLTNLFSGTVTVRVENQRVGNLTISKSVEAAQGQEMPDVSLDYTFQFTSKNGSEPISGPFKSTLVKVDQPEIEKEIDIVDGIVEIKLKAGESFTIWGLPCGSAYTVTEVLLPGFDVSHTTTDQTVNSVTASGSIPHHKAEGDSLEVAYKNVYDGQVHVPLQVVKTLFGRDLAESDHFTFTLAPYGEATIAAVEKGEVVLPGDVTAALTTIGADTGSFAFENITIKGKGTGEKTYQFSIREVLPDDATEDSGYRSGGIVYDPHEAIATVTVTLNKDNHYEATVTYRNPGAPSPTDAANINAAAFTNTGAYDLTIAKQVTGEMGDRDKPFAFQIELENPDGSILTGEYAYTGGIVTGITGAVAPDDDSLKLDAEGKATFALSHGQTITIHGLPVGTTYTITEPDAQADGYTVTASGEDAKMTRDASCNGTLSQETTVTFTNEKATAVPTGIRQDTLPWLLTLVCGLGGCAALCVTGKIRRRKGGCGRTHG